MAHLSLLLLGAFQVLLDGSPVTTFEYDKVRALLAYLAVESDRPHRREALVGLLWPELPERSARQNLSQALFKLRRAINDRDAVPPFLTITPRSLQFNPSSNHWLDVTAFTGLLSACKEHRHRQLEACEPCMDRLQQAVELYRGSFLEGFSLRDSSAFDEWMTFQREQSLRLVTNALHRLSDCHLQRGEYEQALRHTRRWTKLDPLQEGGHRQLMRALALSGQRSVALAQYESCVRILEEELGVEPAEGTLRLYERIRDGEIREGGGKKARAHNLPAQPTPFVGRETELGELDRLLTDPDVRLVTVLGAGGMGKTRLALEAATAQLDRYAHGVFYSSLAPLRSVEAIVPTVASSLGFSFYAGGYAAPAVARLPAREAHAPPARQL